MNPIQLNPPPPQVIRLTESGASANVDMLVGDIYGGDCNKKTVFSVSS